MRGAGSLVVALLALGCGTPHPGVGTDASSDGTGGGGDGTSASDADVDAMVDAMVIDAPPTPACPNWCTETAPAGTGLLYAVHAVNTGDVFAVGDGGTILRRQNNAWSKMTRDRKSTRLNSSHGGISRMPSSA